MNEFTPELIESIARRFKALGDPTRIRILHALMAGPSAVGALAERLDIGQASMSKHLALLRDDGLLVARRHGTQVVYAIEDPSLTELCRLVCDGVRRTANNRHTAVIG
jgi:DNA-binding transcriptional ArsR family regulator